MKYYSIKFKYVYSVCYILQSYWQKTTPPNSNKDITQLIRWNGNGQLRLMAAKDSEGLNLSE